MRKDIEWLKEKVRDIARQEGDGYLYINIQTVLQLIDQLDKPEADGQLDKLANFIMSEVEGEPSQNQGVVDATIRIIKSYQSQEVLSQDWIDEHAVAVAYDGMPDETEIVYVDDLQSLLIPKQEELESKIQELIEVYKQEEDAHSIPENGWISGFIEDLKNLVEEEPLYRARLKVITDEYIASYLRTRFSDNENRLKELEIGNKYIYEDYRHLSEFTEDELKELGIWDSEQWVVEEVEE